MSQGDTTGLRKVDRRSCWTQLQAERVLPPAQWPATHTLELVSADKHASSGFSTDFGHAWIRLVTPQGQVTSVGYFPDESTGIAPERQVGLRFPAMLLHPDKYDRSGFKEWATAIAITPAQFQQLIDWLEQLQAQRHLASLPFSLVDCNCVSFVAAAAARVGIQVDVCYSLPQALRDGSHGWWRGVLNRCLPWLLARIHGRRWFFNVALALRGGRRVHRQQWTLNGQGNRVELHLETLAPLFPTLAHVFTRHVALHHVRALRSWQLTHPMTRHP